MRPGATIVAVIAGTGAVASAAAPATSAAVREYQARVPLALSDGATVLATSRTLHIGSR